MYDVISLLRMHNTLLHVLTAARTYTTISDEEGCIPDERGGTGSVRPGEARHRSGRHPIADRDGLQGSALER